MTHRPCELLIYMTRPNNKNIHSLIAQASYRDEPTPTTAWLVRFSLYFLSLFRMFFSVAKCRHSLQLFLPHHQRETKKPLFLLVYLSCIIVQMNQANYVFLIVRSFTVTFYPKSSYIVLCLQPPTTSGNYPDSLDIPHGWSEPG